MKMVLGNRIVYDNFNMGAASPDHEPGKRSEQVMLTFADKDNEEVHMFQVTESNFEQWVNLVRQTFAGQKIEVSSAEDLRRMQQNAKR